MSLHFGQEKCVFILFCFLNETVSQVKKNSFHPWLLPTRTKEASCAVRGGRQTVCQAGPPWGSY